MNRRMPKVPVTLSENPTWKELIAFTDEKARRARLKADQLEALSKQFREQAKAGEPTPFQVAG